MAPCPVVAYARAPPPPRRADGAPPLPNARAPASPRPRAPQLFEGVPPFWLMDPIEAAKVACNFGQRPEWGAAHG